MFDQVSLPGVTSDHDVETGSTSSHFSRASHVAVKLAVRVGRLINGVKAPMQVPVHIAVTDAFPSISGLASKEPVNDAVIDADAVRTKPPLVLVSVAAKLVVAAALASITISALAEAVNVAVMADAPPLAKPPVAVAVKLVVTLAAPSTRGFSVPYWPTP